MDSLHEYRNNSIVDTKVECFLYIKGNACHLTSIILFGSLRLLMKVLFVNCIQKTEEMMKTSFDRNRDVGWEFIAILLINDLTDFLFYPLSMRIKQIDK